MTTIKTTVQEAVGLSKQVGVMVHWRPDHLRNEREAAEVTGAIIDGEGEL